MIPFVVPLARNEAIDQATPPIRLAAMPPVIPHLCPLPVPATRPNATATASPLGKPTFILPTTMPTTTALLKLNNTRV